MNNKIWGFTDETRKKLEHYKQHTCVFMVNKKCGRCVNCQPCKLPKLPQVKLQIYVGQRNVGQRNGFFNLLQEVYLI